MSIDFAWVMVVEPSRTVGDQTSQLGVEVLKVWVEGLQAILQRRIELLVTVVEAIRITILEL